MLKKVKILIKRDFKAGIKFAVYCAELVLPLYQCPYNSSAPKRAIEMAKDMIMGKKHNDLYSVANDAYKAGKCAIAVNVNSYANFCACFAAYRAANAVVYGGDSSAGNNCCDVAIYNACEDANNSARSAERQDLITKMKDELKRIFESVK